MAKPKWIKVKSESSDGQREIEQFETEYKGFNIIVYPLTKVLENAKGFEYELYNAKRGINYESLHESSNSRITTDSHNDHARDSKQAKEWAITTVDEWDD